MKAHQRRVTGSQLLGILGSEFTMDADVPRVAELLARYRGRSVCSSCLASELAVPVGRVGEVLDQLAGTIALYRGFGICSVCTRTSVATNLASEDARPPVEAVRELFVQLGFGMFCQLCISRHTGLSFAGVQKALWQLRFELDFSRSVGPCMLCGRTRIVAGRPGSTPLTNERDHRSWPICSVCVLSVRLGEAVSARVMRWSTGRAPCRHRLRPRRRSGPAPSQRRQI